MNMGCIYSDCFSLVALVLWQQVTNLAAVVEHCGISPNRYWSLSKFELFLIFFVCLCNLRKICVSNMVMHLTGG